MRMYATVRATICTAMLACAWPAGLAAQAGGTDVAPPPVHSPANPAIPGLADQARIDRAYRNHQALREGRKQLSDLSPQDLADIDALDRYARGQQPDTRSLAQRCIDDELRRAGGTPGGLERRSIATKCREAGD